MLLKLMQPFIKSHFKFNHNRRYFMKRAIFIILFGAILLLDANMLQAQEETIPKATRVGIGVAVGKDFSFIDDGELMFLPIGVSNVYLTIIGSSNYRFEPEIGFWRYTSSSDNHKSTYNNLRLGCGIFPITTQKGKTNLYYGFRLGIVHSTTSSEYNSDDDRESKTDFYIGPSIGGEYFFNDHFSIGGEAQLNYISIGQFNGDNDYKESVIVNKNTIVLRWYF